MSIQNELKANAQRLTSLLGIEAPLIGAPMMGATTAEMTAAVSEAGGLGVFPCGILTADEILASVKAIKTLTSQPFALNLRVTPRETEDLEVTNRLFDALEPLREELGVEHRLAQIPGFDEQFEAVLAADVPVVSFSFGGPREVYAEALEARNVLMMGAVNSTREAKVLKTAGCSVIIAQGVEAGGPRQYFENSYLASQIGLMALLPPVVRVCGDTPVVAAGAMMNARAVAAAMLQGACGAVLGSLLLRTEESAWPQSLKNQIPWCDDASTRLTDLTSGRQTRLVSTGIVEALSAAGLQASYYPGQLKVLQPIFEAAIKQDRPDLLEMALGQAAQSSLKETTRAIVTKLFDDLKNLWSECDAD